MSTARWEPLLLRPTGANPRFPASYPRKSELSRLIGYRRSAFASPRSFCRSSPVRILPIIRAGLSHSPSLAGAAEDAEILFSETFLLKRAQPVEGKVLVRLDRAAEEEGSRWRLTVGCNLEAKWVLHWGVTYCGELGSEWDQPPPQMRPPGSIPVKDYAIETPLKKSPSALEGQVLHEVQMDIDCSCPIAAIHFVLKDEETGAWFQHKGRDFRISLTGYLEEDYKVAGGSQDLSIWPGALNQISNFLLKAEGSHSNSQKTLGETQDAMQQNRNLGGFYDEYSILKEEFVQNFMTVTVKKSKESDKNLVNFDTDIPGDVVVHWGVCRGSNKNWEVPPTPHPPVTKIFRQKALQTLLQPKPNGLGSWGSLAIDKDISGVAFVLKLNEYTWLNNKGTDFYIPLISVSSSPKQASRDQITDEQVERREAEDMRNGRLHDVTLSPKEKSSDRSGLEEPGSGLPDKSGTTEETNQTVAPAIYTDEIVNEIRNLLTDISFENVSGTKSKEAQESILHEIEKLAAKAYSIFRSSSPTFTEESILDADSLDRAVQVCSGTGTGYEILCQGFNWESHKSGRWYSELNAKANELSSLGFTIVWLPPPTESVSPEGYMPKDLYNLNSRYGNMEELKELVKKLHKVGIKALGDVVLNHRCAHRQNKNGVWNIFGGRLNWDDRAIVADDPHFQGKGNKSSGDNFHAAPNIDHSQDFVRKDLKEWLCWLRKEVGYDGWRLDFVRGFWGGYVKDYLEASEPYIAVGEYWDSLSYTYGEMDLNQDAHRQRIIDWINATNGTAGAFDVTTKGILHTALEKCEYSRLSDQKGKPPGVMGWWPSRAVTFIENHDTGSTQGHWRFPKGKEMQGYAYILTHPGTPAVFYDHIFSHYQQEIARLIALRHRTKINCRSVVKISKAVRDVYAAEIDGKIAVKLGPGSYEPASGPREWVLAAEGKDYKVWEAS